MTVSTTVKLAKEKGARLYKEGNFVESIQEYSIAIDNGDSNDNELHLYYRFGRCAVVTVFCSKDGRFLIHRSLFGDC